jgi:AcrR family transcriptional regulator
MTTHQPDRRPTGRPRSFDKEKALDAAMQVFWRKGYEGTSLTDLTEAMGINRPSIYAAFGDKESLYCKVLDRYAAGPTAYIAKALEESDPRVAMERLLMGGADATTSPANPHGCLMLQEAAAESIRRELNARREAGEREICHYLKKAKARRLLPAEAKPGDLARYIVAVMRGMGTQAASGASREELRRVARLAMRALPWTPVS